MATKGNNVTGNRRRGAKTARSGEANAERKPLLRFSEAVKRRQRFVESSAILRQEALDQVCEVLAKVPTHLLIRWLPVFGHYARYPEDDGGDYVG